MEKKKFTIKELILVYRKRFLIHYGFEFTEKEHNFVFIFQKFLFVTYKRIPLLHSNIPNMPSCIRNPNNC